MTTTELTAKSIEAMADDEARETFCALAETYAGTPRWSTYIASQLGVARQTVNNWKRGRVRPSTLAIVAIDAMARAQILGDVLAAQRYADDIASQLFEKFGK